MTRVIIRVEWIDSTISDDGWLPIDDLRAKALPIAVTAGWLMDTSGDEIIVAVAIHGDDAAGVIRIPKSAVVGVPVVWDGQVGEHATFLTLPGVES